MFCVLFFFFKQKTAYEMRISDWSSDVCSSDLWNGATCPRSSEERDAVVMATKAIVGEKVGMTQVWDDDNRVVPVTVLRVKPCRVVQVKTDEHDGYSALQVTFGTKKASKITKPKLGQFRSEEHTSELQSLMRISY